MFRALSSVDTDVNVEDGSFPTVRAASALSARRRQHAAQFARRGVYDREVASILHCFVFVQRCGTCGKSNRVQSRRNEKENKLLTEEKLICSMGRRSS